MNKEKRQIVSTIISISVALGMIMSAFAMIIYVPDIVTGTDSNILVDAAPPSTMIMLKNANFNTAMGNPELPSTLAINSYPDHVQGTYILQKDGAITEEWKAEITRAGGEILSYIPDNAFLIRMDNSVKDNVGSVRGNQWMGIYQPAYKISPELNGRHGQITVDIDIFNGGNNGPAVRFLKENAGSIQSVVNNDRVNLIRAQFDASLLGHIAAMPDVHWLSEFMQPVPFNDGTVPITQSGVGGTTTPLFDHGINGQNQIIAMTDSGLAESLGVSDIDHANFNGNVYGAGGNEPKVLNYYVPIGADGALGDESTSAFHGSHCAGTAVGDGGTYGAWGTSTYDGHAYMAQLVFQDAGREDDPATSTNEAEYIYPPSDYYNDMYGDAESYGAKVHSITWGGGFGYSDDSAISDLYIWDSQDYSVCKGVGGDVAPYTIPTLGESKNTIAVTSVSAIGTSVSTFSSRGPAMDGRIKPDIAQCGESIMSVDGGGGYQSMQGTSMATAGAAGNVLLARQYYEEGWYPTGTKILANGFTPSAALLKATLINGAEDISSSRPDMNQGWGRIHMDNSLYFSGDSLKMFAYDNVQGMVTGDYMDFKLSVDSNTDFTVTLAYTDYPGDPAAAKALVNDLGLLVIGPGSTEWRGNNFASGYSQNTGTSNNYDELNNIEGVKILNPALGTYTIRISAEAIAIGPQNFALVASGGLDEGYGKVFMDRAVYDETDTIALTVEDSNSLTSTASITLTTAITGDTEIINIPWTTALSGLYNGVINTGIGITQNYDGILQVSDGDIITATYIDSIPGSTATTTAYVDFHGPVISNVFVTGITGTSAAPTWDTDENADSTVYYREYGQTSWNMAANSHLVVDHLISLTGLATDTKYEFYVESTDWRGRTTADDHGEAYYTFRTAGTASGGPLILLVDDDIGSISNIDGSPYELDWKNNLDNKGWTYTHWDMNILGSPNTADLNQAAMIVWITAEGYPQIGVDDRTALEGYLDQPLTSSGTVPMAYISGQDIGWDMSPVGTDPDPQWLSDYLGATFNRDDADGGNGNEGYITGIDPMRVTDIGHAVNDVYNFVNMDLEQDVYGDGRFWPDSINAVAPAVPSWDYVLSKVTGDCAGTAQTGGGGTGTARILYEAFSHDMLTSLTTSNWGPALATPIIDSRRAGVLDESIQWLLGGNHPTIDLSNPIGGELITASSTHTIFWNVSGASEIDVYYSPNAGQEYIKLNGAPLAGGTLSYPWDISNLDDGTQYRIKVVAIGSATYATLSDYSESGLFEIDHDYDVTPPITIPGSVNVDINPIEPGDTVTLTAIIDDTITGMSNIAAADWMLWPTDPTLGEWTANGQSMAATDGTFDEIIEDVTITIPGAITAGWATSTWHNLWVRGVDSAGNEAASYQVEIYVAGYELWFPYDIPIPPGAGAGDWVFVSFPYVMSGDIETILADANGGTTWDIAKWYDASTQSWKTYSTLGAGINTLVTINQNMGVWLRLVTNDGILTINGFGDYSATPVQINLYAGWNMVGYPSGTARLASVALAGTGATWVATYQPTAPYITDYSNLAAVTMSEGNAYWVYVPADVTWNVQP